MKAQRRSISIAQLSNLGASWGRWLKPRSGRYPLYRKLGVMYGNVKKVAVCKLVNNAVGYVRIKLVSLMRCEQKTYKFKHEY